MTPQILTAVISVSSALAAFVYALPKLLGGLRRVERNTNGSVNTMLAIIKMQSEQITRLTAENIKLSHVKGEQKK